MYYFAQYSIEACINSIHSIVFRYDAGVACQLVVAPESRVSRKPFIIGFEGAASLPYSGCIALSALKEASLEETTSVGKR